LGYVEKVVFNFDKETGKGHQSRMVFSEKGKEIFRKQIKETEQVEEIYEQDLIILTDKEIVLRNYVDKNGKERVKKVKITKVIPIERTEDLLIAEGLKDNLRLINNFYRNHRLTVRAKDLEINGEHFLEEVCVNYRTNRIKEIKFDFSVLVDGKLFNKEEINKIKYKYKTYKEIKDYKEDKTPKNKKLIRLNKLIKYIERLNNIDKVN
jgi:hypothetical protein